MAARHCIIIVMFAFIFFFIEVSGHCLERHKSLLLKFKHSLVINESSIDVDDDSYHEISPKLANWNSSTDCCLWPGVTCSGMYVTGLDLSNEGIVGGFNDSSPLFDLTSLTSLNLAYMEQATVIPSGIGRLVNLMNLDIFSSGFSGQIPIEISNLTRLVSLDLSSFGYHLKAENPNLRMLVGNLSNLIDLRLDNVNLSSQSREWCQVLSSSTPRLQVLNLRYCGLLGPIHDSLQNLTHLSIVDISYNNFSGPIPYGVFASLENLTSLALIDNEFNGVFPHTMLQFPTLRFLDMSYNNFLEASPSTITFQNSSLETLLLSELRIFKTIPESIGEAKMLSYLDLTNCNLSGQIPESISQLEHLVHLGLSFNNLDGRIPSLSRSRNLTVLDLSYNQLNGSILATDWKKLPQMEILKLQSNNLSGSIPGCLFQTPSLVKLLDLEGNNFTGFTNNESNLIGSSSHLLRLNLRGNNLQWSFPPFISRLISHLLLLDLSDTQIAGHLNNILWSNSSRLSDMLYFSVSSNKLHGRIPESICNATNLQVLDLSNNLISGTLPQCLTQLPNLRVLNLGNNNISGIIPDSLPSPCLLQTLDLSQNSFQGEIPKSLGGCGAMKVLNLGYNKLHDMFPCWMTNVDIIRVLVLRSNSLYGNTRCLNQNSNWRRLQIMDIASNNFGGSLPSQGLLSWDIMLIGKHDEDEQSHLYYYYNYYQQSRNLSSPTSFFVPVQFENTVSAIVKGYQRVWTKIPTIFTLVDFSDNKFEGSIPCELGELKFLYVLNLSRNHLSGQIPSSFGNLTCVESLDLSKNELGGKIPEQLAALNFLEVLNLSSNQLEGLIPKGRQFQTFTEASFKGNKDLCGQPLNRSCGNVGMSSPPNLSSKSEDHKFRDIFIATEIGYALGLGLVIMPLIFWSRWREKYYKCIDKVLMNIFYCQPKKSPVSRTIRRRN